MSKWKCPQKWGQNLKKLPSQTKSARVKPKDSVTLERGHLSLFRYPTRGNGTYLGRGECMQHWTGIQVHLHAGDLVINSVWGLARKQDAASHRSLSTRPSAPASAATTAPPPVQRSTISLIGLVWVVLAFSSGVGYFQDFEELVWWAVKFFLVPLHGLWQTLFLDVLTRTAPIYCFGQMSTTVNY